MSHSFLYQRPLFNRFSLPVSAAKAKRSNLKSNGQRGPAEHERREQILNAANVYFRNYGYAKTTVADLAKAIGLSPAYIYKFFESKQAIGDAVCRQTLGRVANELRRIIGLHKPAATRMRLVYQTVARRGAESGMSKKLTAIRWRVKGIGLSCFRMRSVPAIRLAEQGCPGAAAWGGVGLTGRPGGRRNCAEKGGVAAGVGWHRVGKGYLAA